MSPYIEICVWLQGGIGGLLYFGDWRVWGIGESGDQEIEGYRATWPTGPTSSHRCPTTPWTPLSSYTCPSSSTPPPCPWSYQQPRNMERCCMETCSTWAGYGAPLSTTWELTYWKFMEYCNKWWNSFHMHPPGLILDCDAHCTAASSQPRSLN